MGQFRWSGLPPRRALLSWKLFSHDWSLSPMGQEAHIHIMGPLCRQHSPTTSFLHFTCRLSSAELRPGLSVARVCSEMASPMVAASLFAQSSSSFLSRSRELPSSKEARSFLLRRGTNLQLLLSTPHGLAGYTGRCVRCYNSGEESKGKVETDRKLWRNSV